MASLVIMMDSSLPSNQQPVVLVLESMPIIIKLTKTYPNEKKWFFNRDPYNWVVYIIFFHCSNDHPTGCFVVVPFRLQTTSAEQTPQASHMFSIHVTCFHTILHLALEVIRPAGDPEIRRSSLGAWMLKKRGFFLWFAMCFGGSTTTTTTGTTTTIPACTWFFRHASVHVFELLHRPWRVWIRLQRFQHRLQISMSIRMLIVQRATYILLLKGRFHHLHSCVIIHRPLLQPPKKPRRDI